MRVYDGVGSEAPTRSGTQFVVGVMEAKTPEAVNILALRHPKEEQICHITHVLNKKRSAIA